MSNRITQSDLEHRVKQINEVTDSSSEPYTKDRDGQLAANIGNHHLDYAYGGVRLVKMVNLGGAITVLSNGGFGTKRELYNWMDAFLAGIAI